MYFNEERLKRSVELLNDGAKLAYCSSHASTFRKSSTMTFVACALTFLSIGFVYVLLAKLLQMDI